MPKSLGSSPTQEYLLLIKKNRVFRGVKSREAGLRVVREGFYSVLHPCAPQWLFSNLLLFPTGSLIHFLSLSLFPGCPDPPILPVSRRGIAGVLKIQMKCSASWWKKRSNAWPQRRLSTLSELTTSCSCLCPWMQPLTKVACSLSKALVWMEAEV